MSDVILSDDGKQQQSNVDFERPAGRGAEACEIRSITLSFPHILSAFFATYIYLWKKSIEKGIDKDRLALFKKKGK